MSLLVSEILERVKKEGESAVRYYSEKFDKWNPASFRLSDEEISQAEAMLPVNLKEEIVFLRDQVRNFAEAQRNTLVDFEKETLPGVFLGQKYLPIESVGVYVPGGRYTLIASSQMSITPARVAGSPARVAGRAARCTGGLWVGKYMKNVTYQRLERKGSLLIAPHAARIARAEGMVAHERSAEIRIRKYSTR